MQAAIARRFNHDARPYRRRYRGEEKNRSLASAGSSRSFYWIILFDWFRRVFCAASSLCFRHCVIMMIQG